MDQPCNPSATSIVKQYRHLKFIEQLRNNLQKGDLCLSDIKQYNFVFYGQTKTGKTSSCHIVSGNSVKCVKKNGQFVLTCPTSKDRIAAIGNQSKSQTMIPNYFKVKLKNGKYIGSSTYVVDTPGYGDTYGVFRILANGFYHYRLYSKAQKMKFVICIDKNHLSNTAKQFLDTLMQFTSSFKNYLQIKETIWQSCAFLVTKAQGQNPQADLEAKLLSIAQKMATQYQPEDEEAMKQFIRYIVQKKKIFYIKKYINGQSVNGNGLLQKIDEKIGTWYSRKIDPVKNIVDMSPISFSLAKQLVNAATERKKSQQQFIQIVSYYKNIINNFLSLQKKCNNTIGSLSNVIGELVNDAMGKSDSHNYLKLMDHYINSYYDGYDSAYNEERSNKQKQLFGLTQGQKSQGNSQSSRSITKNSSKYVLKKFGCLENIEVIKKQVYGKQFSRSMEWLEQAQTNIYKILKQFNKVSYKENTCEKIIYKYSYVIHRIFEEAKMFFLLIQISCPKSVQEQIKKIAGQFIDICIPLKDFMEVQYSYDKKTNLFYKDLKQLHIKNIDLSEQTLQKQVIDVAYIQFVDSNKNYNLKNSISSIKDSKQENILQAGVKSQILAPNNESQQVKQDSIITLKVIKLLIKYSSQVLDENIQRSEVNKTSLINLVKKLTPLRIKCEDLYSLSEDQNNKTELMILIIQISQNMAKLLELSNLFKEARDIYDSIQYVSAVNMLYEKEINELDKIKQSKKNEKCSISARIQYSRYLANHFLEQKAMSVLQDAYQIAKNSTDLMRVSKQITDLRLEGYNRVTHYGQQLFAREYYEKFSEELKDRLLSI